MNSKVCANFSLLGNNSLYCLFTEAYYAVGNQFLVRDSIILSLWTIYSVKWIVCPELVLNTHNPDTLILISTICTFEFYAESALMFWFQISAIFLFSHLLYAKLFAFLLFSPFIRHNKMNFRHSLVINKISIKINLKINKRSRSMSDLNIHDQKISLWIDQSPDLTVWLGCF